MAILKYYPLQLHNRVDIEYSVYFTMNLSNILHVANYLGVVIVRLGYHYSHNCSYAAVNSMFERRYSIG